MQHETHRVPVTAVAFFHSDIIFAGEGNYLRAYSTDSRPLFSHRIFEDQAIHGIVPENIDGSIVLVYGASLLRFLVLEHGQDVSFTIRLGPLQNVGDWILDASFAPTALDAVGPAASVVTAHNALHVARLNGQVQDSDCAQCVDIESLVSRSNCILYSAHISWLSPSQCLIASGTAFGDVIVWSAFLSDRHATSAARTQTHYTFSAHEGSVFGVHISSPLTLPKSSQEQRVLETCSDDRNIKLWDISDLTTTNPSPGKLQRETGFGSAERRLDVAPPLLARIMGHISRIWQVRFVEEDDRELRKIQSFGEDASVITWALRPSRNTSELPFTLEKVDAVLAHSGKNIWSIGKAISGNLVTGGADGAIAMYSSVESVDHPVEISKMCTDSAESDGILKSYCFVDTDTLISTTNHGCVIRINLAGEDDIEKMALISGAITSLRGFSIITSVSGHAFIAGADGKVFLYVQREDCISEIASGNGKPAGLFACQYSANEAALLLTTVGSPLAKLLRTNTDLDGRERRKGQEILLDLPSGFIVTSFSMMMHGSTAYAILGSRNGSLAVYNQLQERHSDPASPSRVYSLAHGKEAITHLHIHTEIGLNQTTWLLSTGRDGTFAIHRMAFHNDRLDLSTVHQLSLPFGPNIEGVSLSPTGSLLTWGFRSKHFVVYDLSHQKEVMAVECGGAHRNWAFQPNAAGGTLIWTKASKVYRRTQTDLPYQLINPGGHGREIKSVAISPSKPQIIATGAEDTDIKLHRLEDGRFKCLHTLRKHNTGVQCLQWSADGRYLFSSGGFEEFFVWRISLGAPCVDVGVVCESKHPRSGTSDLRITGFDVSEQLADVDTNPRHFTIIMAYSDSTAKVWIYASETWQLHASGDYLTACLSHTLWTHDSHSDFITAATDGHIASWHVDQHNKSSTWSNRHQAHQSAIHAVTTRKLPDDSTLIVTGGDDNAIGLTRVRSVDGSRWTAKTLRVPSAHAAAVTGLVLVPVDGSVYWIVSASIDQRVKLWEVEIELGGDGVGVEVLRSAFTAVADVAGLDLCVLEDGKMGVLVCGVGMDVWRLP